MGGNSPWAIVLAGVIFINLVAFAAFGVDKYLARSKTRRISESTLLWLVALGGGAGAIAGQRRFRHKTQKQPFKRRMWTVIAVQALIILIVFVRSSWG